MPRTHQAFKRSKGRPHPVDPRGTPPANATLGSVPSKDQASPSTTWARSTPRAICRHNGGMPVISVTLLPGYAPDVQARLTERLACAARSVIPATEAGTTVMVHEASTYRRDGRVMAAGAPARPDLVPVALACLQALDANALSDVAAWLSPQGSGLMQVGQVRQREVLHTESCWMGHEEVVLVHSRCLLAQGHGALLAQTRLDRLVFSQGLLGLHQVWHHVGSDDT